MNTPEAKERKAKYKASLNLPTYPVPDARQPGGKREAVARALGRREPARPPAREAARRPPFVFHDGPPFANGSIHIGHLLNKVLKDLVVRTRNMNGELCHYVPGWDATACRSSTR